MTKTRPKRRGTTTKPAASGAAKTAKSAGTDRRNRNGRAGAKLPGEVYDPDEMDRILKACGRGPTGRRNKALIVLCWRCGLRINEALELRPDDVNMKQSRLHVRDGKGHKDRKLGIPSDARDALELWMADRRTMRLNGRHPIFCTLTEGNKGQKLKHPYIVVMLARLRDRSGLEKRLHAHGFRHTFAWERSVEGVTLPLISRMLGHENIATTARYLAHVAPIDVIEAMQNL